MITVNYFPGMSIFIEKIFNNSNLKSRQFTDIFSSTINIFELSLQLFNALTIRFFEERLIKENELYKNKTKPINDILRNRYVAPSLGTHAILAKYCTHLIDNSAPPELIKMKEKLNESILLGPIGLYLNDLTKIYELLEEQQENPPIFIDREKSKKTLLSVINDFIAFRNDSAHISNIRNIIEDNEPKLNLKIDTWHDAFLKICDSLKSFLELEFRLKTLERIYSEGETKFISIHNRNFFNGLFNDSIENTKLEEWYEDQWSEKSEIVLADKEGNKKPITIFPFLVLKDDKLFIYKKTKSSGYQYFSLIDSSLYTVKSKKKFNHSIFNTPSSGNSQALFWAEVPLKTNHKTNVKANIPSQGTIKFIGRKKQINMILENIIEIPNENGIIYGTGGIGKTALLIELSKQLFEETNKKKVPYDNIIWVSAKRNFYNWEQNATITNKQQFESLHNILQIVLRFFDYEDVDEYSIEEIKEFVFEILETNKVLLILDNFETITKAETNKIIEFFGSDVKKHLKHLPKYFKVLITSRELIPSGYHPIKLMGLEFKESQMLINNIYERYKSTHPELTYEQCTLIHNATLGIPIVIKHCLGQIFEFNVPFSDVLTKISEGENEVIKFSYTEIFSYLRNDNLYLQILILLEIYNEPISIRQISVILGTPINDINKHMSNLLNYLCIDKINIGIEEKYIISHQIGLLSKGLVKENPTVVSNIRKNLLCNFTSEKRMDYEVEELEIIEVFKGYLESRDFHYAEHFLNGEINKRPNSFILRFQYALFIRDVKKEYHRSIKILENIDLDIIKTGQRDVNILLALATTYTLLASPDYINANQCCLELLKISPTTQNYLFFAEFLINWSTALKIKKEMDPINDISRIEKIKELAKEGIKHIEATKFEINSHKYQYLIAQAFFNQWNVEKAKVHLLKAIDLAQNDFSIAAKYEKFLKNINKYIT